MVNNGHSVEREVYELLCRRFGRDCVYLSPMFKKAGGKKEVCDVLVLALPYAIAFQIKWMALSSDDLANSEVKHGRMLRRMREAADQFAEIFSTIDHSYEVVLPQIWGTDPSVTFKLPMQRIEHLIPVVLMDFEDRNYDDPEKRYCDLPPVVVDVGKRVGAYGCVHAFLKSDFARIADQLFTVGDLMLWLTERAKLFGDKPKTFLGYNELTVFSLYLINNPLFRKFSGYDGVLLYDQALFERMLTEREEQFAKRKAIYGSPCLLDIIEGKIANAVVQMGKDPYANELILEYLEYSGRIKRLHSVARRELSDRLTKNIESYNPVPGKEALKGSYVIFCEGTVASTLYYFAASEFTAEVAPKYCEYGYLRGLSYAVDRGLANRIREIFVLFVRKDRPDFCCKVFKVQPKDFAHVMTPEELNNTRFSFSVGKMKTTEWKYAEDCVARSGNSIPDNLNQML